jgi:septum formation topological specificity factor MinE
MINGHRPPEFRQRGERLPRRAKRRLGLLLDAARERLEAQRRAEEHLHQETLNVLCVAAILIAIALAIACL